MSIDPIAPWWVLAVVAVALLAVCGLCLVTRRGQRLAWTRRVLMVLALLVLAAQPAAGTAAANADRSNLDVVIAVDTSPSANAMDYDGKQTRLAGVRGDIRALATQLDGARFALVTFDNEAKQVLPFSTDTSALDTALSVLEPEDTLYSNGSTLDRPVTLLHQILAQDAKSNPTRQRMLVLTSDGEQTVDHPPGSFASLRQYVTGGAVLGYGTTRGGAMDEYDPDDPNSHTLITDSDGATAISKIDEANLRRAASQLGVPYHHRTAPGGVSVALPPVHPVAATSPTQVGRPLYWIPAIALGVLALWEAAAVAVRR